MNPFQPQLLPGVSDIPLAINDEADPKTVKTYERVFRATCQGMPSAFFLAQTFAIAESALEDGYLVPMQDYKWFGDIFDRR
jgi:hypothetical protein